MSRNHGQSLLAALGVASMMLAGPAGASELDEGPVNLEYECGEGALSAHHEEDFGGTALRVLGIYEADDEEFGPDVIEEGLRHAWHVFVAGANRCIEQQMPLQVVS